MKDTKTPVIVSIFSVLINILLCFLFIQWFKFDIWGLGLASSISGTVSLVMLLAFLQRKIGGFNRGNLVNPILKMVFAALVAAVALYMPIKALDKLVFDTTKTINLIFLTGIASVFGLGIYLILVWSMQVKELYTYSNLIKKVYNFKIDFHPEEIQEDTKV
jgi:putative peptidoglycan lipid II flippase